MSLTKERLRWTGAWPVPADRHIGVDGLRRTRRAVPRGGQTAGDGPRGGRTAGAVLDVFHPGDQADQRRSQLDPAAAGYRARRGTTVGALAAGTRLAGPQLRAPRRAGPDHGRPRGPLASVRIANRRRTDDAPLQDRGLTGRPERRRPRRDGDGDRLLALPDRGGRPRRDRRPRARQTGLRGARPTTGPAPRSPGWHRLSPWCPRRSTATT